MNAKKILGAWLNYPGYFYERSVETDDVSYMLTKILCRFWKVLQSAVLFI